MSLWPGWVCFLFLFFIFHFFLCAEVVLLCRREKRKDVCDCLKANLFNSRSNCGEDGKSEWGYLLRCLCRCGARAVWEQWAAFLALSACLMTIKFPSSLILFFLDGMFDYLSEGKGGGEVGHNKHVTNVCFVFHSESHALYQIHRK